MTTQNSTPAHNQPSPITIASKPTRIKLTQDIDFFELFKRIEVQYNTCYLLESLGAESHISRHHAIGFDPIMTIAATDRNTLAITDNQTGKTETYSTDNPDTEALNPRYRDAESTLSERMSYNHSASANRQPTVITEDAVEDEKSENIVAESDQWQDGLRRDESDKA